MKKILLSILFLLLITSCSINNGIINLKENGNKNIGLNSINNATSKDIYEKLSKCQKWNSLIDINCINWIFPDSIKSNEALVSSFEEMNKCNYFSLSDEKELYSKCLKNIYINYPSNLFWNVSLCTSYFVVGNYDETISCINNINDHTITTLEWLKWMSYILKWEVEKWVNICKKSYIKNPLNNTLKKCIKTWNNACIFNWINYQVPENAHCLVNDNYNAWQCDKWYFEIQGKCLINDNTKTIKKSTTNSNTSNDTTYKYNTDRVVFHKYSADWTKHPVYLSNWKLIVKNPNWWYFILADWVNSTNLRHKITMNKSKRLPF